MGVRPSTDIYRPANVRSRAVRLHVFCSLLFVSVSPKGNVEIVEFLAGEMQGSGAARECYMITEYCR